jgi:hypothetical protein
MRESRLSGSVEGVLRNPDPYSDSVGVDANDQTYSKGAPFYNASSSRNVWSAAELQAKNEEWQVVCANVFGLGWSP